jgi:hypothetical protein
VSYLPAAKAYDGVHHGHQLIAQTKEGAREHSKQVRLAHCPVARADEKVLREAGVDMKESDGHYTFSEHKVDASHHDTPSFDKDHAADKHSNGRKHEHADAAESASDEHSRRVLGGFKAYVNCLASGVRPL